MYATQLSYDDKKDYESINQPHEMNREEKDQLLFQLMQIMGYTAYRAKFEPTLVVLVKETM